MKEQKVVTVSRSYGQYHNFFYTPGSMGSLENYIKDGWTLIHLNDDRQNEQAIAIFERPKKTSAPSVLSNEYPYVQHLGFKNFLYVFFSNIKLVRRYIGGKWQRFQLAEAPDDHPEWMNVKEFIAVSFEMDREEYHK